MTATGDDAPPPIEDTQPAPDQAPRAGRRREAAAVLEVCPFLAAEGAAWRSAYAAREHRCHAVRPPAVLAIAKQRQLCLLADHVTCATYVAARAVAADALPAMPGDDGAGLWTGAASTPLVLEPARRMGTLPGASARSGGQALLVGLMVLAFIVLVIARTQSPMASDNASPGQSAAVVAASSPPAAASTPAAEPSPSILASPSLDPGPSPEPSPSPTGAVTPTPAPTAETRRYRVKAGDTLSAIAARYGTTVRILADLNDIADPRVIRIGQVLVIP